MSDSALKVRDPVHNFIELNDKEVRIIDSQAFQRLRGIKQLALANLVYPGALHTRFDHSIGVSHVAGMMAKEMEFVGDDIELVRLAALLHDVGHGPFSHVSEHALEYFADRASVPDDQKMEKIHELVTARIILDDEQIRSVLGSHRCEEIVSLLGEWNGEAALKSVVSGPMDADKQDYLLRDSYFCGVKYGTFDLRQLHRSVKSIRSNRSKELVLDIDGIHAAEQFALAKYYMTANVYRHKVRLITDQMIVRAIILGIEQDEIDELRSLYTFDNSADFVAEYRKWDDARFNEFFGSTRFEGKLCHGLLQRLQQRRLLKRVFHGKVKDLKPEVREPLSKLSKPSNSESRKRIESTLSEHIASVLGTSIDANFVILHAFGIKSVKEMSRNDEAGILVKDGTTKAHFEDMSALFASIQEGYKEEYVEVYAPILWQERERREDFCEELKLGIVDILESIKPENNGEERS